MFKPIKITVFKKEKHFNFVSRNCRIVDLEEGEPKNLVDITHRMQIGKYCDMKGAELGRREWLCLQGIAFRV